MVVWMCWQTSDPPQRNISYRGTSAKPTWQLILPRSPCPDLIPHILFLLLALHTPTTRIHYTLSSCSMTSTIHSVFRRLLVSEAETKQASNPVEHVCGVPLHRRIQFLKDVAEVYSRCTSYNSKG
jgi:hypothetical protein